MASGVTGSGLQWPRFVSVGSVKFCEVWCLAALPAISDCCIRSPWVHCGPLSTMSISKNLSQPGLVPWVSGGEPKKIQNEPQSQILSLFCPLLSPSPHSWRSNSQEYLQVLRALPCFHGCPVGLGGG